MYTHRDSKGISRQRTTWSAISGWPISSCGCPAAWSEIGVPITLDGFAEFVLGSAARSSLLTRASVDGGGVRYLFTLYILQGLMQRVNNARQALGKEAVKPRQIFDMIGTIPYHKEETRNGLSRKQVDPLPHPDSVGYLATQHDDYGR